MLGRLIKRSLILQAGTCLLFLSGCMSVPQCDDREEPYLILTATPTLGDPPISVIGRACGGNAIDPQTLSNNYEVIIYAYTNKWYIQPFVSSFRERFNEYGFFMTRSHLGDQIHAFVAQRGIPWEAELDSLPAVDGVFIIAEAEVNVGN